MLTRRFAPKPLLTQGVYEYPREHKELGILPPKVEAVAKAIAEKNMRPAGTKVGLVIQAFRHLGKDNIDKIVCDKTRKFLTGLSRNELVKNLKYAPQWIRIYILNIMEIKS